MTNIILASGSPRRAKLLKSAGVKFKVIKSNTNEKNLARRFKILNFKTFVRILSFLKAVSVLKNKEKTKYFKGNEIILGFDTIVVCNNKIIDKPKNKKDALKKLLLLSGKTHNVLTGFCIINLKTKKIIADHESTKVTMKKITKQDITNYIATGEPFDKAGAYAIQGKGSKFIKKIRGDYSNVVGLPLTRFTKILNLSIKDTI